MKLEEAIRDSRSTVNEHTPRFYKDDDFIRWINEGAKDIARRTEFLQATEDIAIVAATGEYTLAEDILRLTKVNFVPDSSPTLNHKLDYVDIQSIDDFYGLTPSTQGPPCLYTLWGYPPNLKITIYPTPAEAGTLTVYYYKIPAFVDVPSEDLPIPDQWADLLGKYCTYRALLKDRDPGWQVFKGLYEADVDNMIQMTRRFSDQAGMMTAVSGSMVPRHLWDWDY